VYHIQIKFRGFSDNPSYIAGIGDLTFVDRCPESVFQNEPRIVTNPESFTKSHLCLYRVSVLVFCYDAPESIREFELSSSEWFRVSTTLHVNCRYITHGIDRASIRFQSCGLNPKHGTVNEEVSEITGKTDMMEALTGTKASGRICSRSRPLWSANLAEARATVAYHL
jgi:hypothetical protein